MRQTLFFILIALMVSIIIAPTAIADETKDGDQACSGDQSCEMEGECSGECSSEEGECQDMGMMGMHDMEGPHMGEGVRMHDMEGPHMGEGPMMECGPMMGWGDRPWDMWRHMDERSLDFDAIRFMGSVRRIAILPFGDMTSPTVNGQTKLQEAGGPRRLVDNLAAEFMRWGYLVVPPPDVEAFYNVVIHGVEPRLEGTEGNNHFWFENMPDRAMDFYAEMVPGLADQRLGNYQAQVWLSRENIIQIAEVMEADCVIRGFVNEYSVSRDIDADWRTFVPPFLGLLNPDRRVTMEVAYYLYDGHSGEMIWNGTVDIQNDTNWPLFTSDMELINDSEHAAAWQMTGHVLPNWGNMVMGHPDWIPFRMWHEDFDGCMMDMGPMMRPDWVNPYRMGWHDEYYRDDAKIDIDPVENPPERPWFRDLGHSYNGIRRYMGER